MTNELKEQHVQWSKVAAIDVVAIKTMDALTAWIIANRYRLADLEIQAPTAAATLRTVLHEHDQTLRLEQIRQGVG